VGFLGVALGLRDPTSLRLGIEDAKSRCPSPEGEGMIGSQPEESKYITP
jgi:hypothetical protein